MVADRAPQRGRKRSFLGWALFISLAVHVALAPLVAHYKPPHEPTATEQPFHIGDIRAMPRATPPPTPRPTAKLSPAALLPAQNVRSAAALAPHAAHLHVPHTASASSPRGPIESVYTGGSGDRPGTTNGPGSAGPDVVASASLTLATPTPTPKPVCAQPHVAASVVRTADPGYPELPKEQGVTGIVKVRVTLSDTGDVVAADVYGTSGNAQLDNAALAAAKASTYAPEIEDCRKIPGQYLFRAEFSGQ